MNVPLELAPARPDRPPLTYGRVVVIGGGCYGSWYTQQLQRAVARGALTAREIVVVDRDPACRVAARLASGEGAGGPVRLAVAAWDDYLAAWLGEGPEAVADDRLVPSPLMPHLCLDWLLARARQRWPGRAVGVAPLDAPVGTPWERAAPDARQYVSFATWTCPVNCIEPARCPATRGPRDWSLPPTLAAHVARTPGVRGPVIFHCTHRCYGVGMIDACAIAEADQRVAAWGAQGPAQVLVGTVSHCHGALGLLAIA
jgi:hypothetical protein